MAGKRWIVEVTKIDSNGDRISFGSQVNYLPELFYVPPLSLNPHFDHVKNLPEQLIQAINANSIDEFVVRRNKNYDPSQDNLDRSSYP